MVVGTQGIGMTRGCVLRRFARSCGRRMPQSRMQAVQVEFGLRMGTWGLLCVDNMDNREGHICFQRGSLRSKVIKNRECRECIVATDEKKRSLELERAKALYNYNLAN